jgi:dihydrodipicolinate synthase/N-acetylneuraminate lyase
MANHSRAFHPGPTMMSVEPLSLLRPKSSIIGMSAILLPFTPGGEIDWRGFDAHLLRTQTFGLTPAVNMDTGYVNLLEPRQRLEVLDRTRAVLGGAPFVAGAFVADRPGDRLALDEYLRQTGAIQERGGAPIIFQSFGLTGLASDELIDAYRAIARACPRFLAFELGTMFAPFGRIYDLQTYEELLAIPECVGAKHSSLSRELEWRRLALRNKARPDFMVLTGNDLAIDMVMYGSGYLLGLSTFAPDLFARRDAMWRRGDSEFYELNDLLQYLGFFAFRPPVPAYKHSAAQLLRLCGWVDCDLTHRGSPRRPDSDRAVLADIVERLSAWRGTAS